ncbi:MAG: hemin uptake protein HemP [Pseudoxanthomonas sp.]
MSAQPVFVSRTEPGVFHERVVPQPVRAEDTLSSESLLNGRREILISHGDRVYRLRHTSNDKLILTK